jgi:serralysin
MATIINGRLACTGFKPAMLYGTHSASWFAPVSYSSVNTGVDLLGLKSLDTDPVVKALLNGSVSNDNRAPNGSITYSFNETPGYTFYSGYTPSGDLYEGFTPPGEDMRVATDSVFKAVSDFTNLKTSYTTGQGVVEFSTINIDQTLGVEGFETSKDDTTPNGGHSGVFMPSYYHGYDQGSDHAFVLTHEIGHALGLSHPMEGQYAVADSNNSTSIMAYSTYRPIHATISDNGVGGEVVKPDGFMMDDIAALQAMYGANTTATSGNDVYRYGDKAFYHCISDSGGVDTIDVSAATSHNDINMNEGTFSSVSLVTVEDQIELLVKKYESMGYDEQTSRDLTDYMNTHKEMFYTGEKALSIAYGTVIENVVCGNHGDVVTDNKYNNNIVGGSGNDSFVFGAGGYDTVDGGAGYDTITVNTLSKNTSSIEHVNGTDTYVLTGGHLKITFTGIEQVNYADGYTLIS